MPDFESHLNKLEADHLLRRLRPVEPESAALVMVRGRPIIQMASNNYLGLASHPSLKQAAIEAVSRFGVGAGASRLISGTLPPHEELESTLARFKGTESALTFGAGYLANIGLIPALVDTGGLILADRLCHASLIDGCRLSGADFRVFHHRDLDHLESLLSKRRAPRETQIVTDGVFSMDGDLAPIPELIDLADRYEARLFVDDAHGTGVMGASGRGILEHFGVESRLPYHMGTLGKALGTSGAYVVGPARLIDYFVNTVRSFVYTTAPPPADAAAARAALDILHAEPDRRARLWDNRKHVHAGLTALGFKTTATQSPIMPVLIGDADKAMQMAERLLELGVYAPAIRPPTVPKDSSRIRVTVTSEHSRAQLDAALAAFRTAGQDLRLI
jgi:glycine C-acetyltransferase/8-amino-7-oxononanoate synthase